uniref:Phosphatidic acid phosphatase type 2/haloperoxidase domain-containing protein n=1 Tax=Cuerna arida TaxID=1464854 RepID=A0A1B6GLP9_9HEMI
MDAESKSILRKVIIDILCLFCVGFPILIFFLWGVPYKRGFFCDDDSIRFPYKDSTVTKGMLYAVGICMPICVFLTVEWIHFREGERQASRRFMGHSIHPWLWRCYCIIGVFGFGMASCQLLTDIAKYSVGRLRPHFLAICQPNINCSLPEYQRVYIEDFTCMGTNAKLIRASRLSFLSGHSSFAAYTMVFLTLYIQCRVHWRGSYLLRHFAQFVCLATAWSIAMSRVSNYKHHWSDVLAGSLLGTVVAIIVVKFMSDLKLEDTHEYTPPPGCDPAQSNGGITLTATSDP